MNRHHAAVAILAASSLSGAAMAAPVAYTFSTSTGLIAFSTPADLVELLDARAVKVSGQFTYDAAGGVFVGDSASLGSEPGYAIYTYTSSSRPYGQLTGQVGALKFSDTHGTVAVSNDDPHLNGQDVLSLMADPGPKGGQLPSAERERNLQGFTVGDYQLYNVRLFWSAGLLNQGDFLGSDAMPADLPAFPGFVALDFIRLSDPASANQPYGSATAMFYGLNVSAVPEPSSWGMALIGMSIAGGMALRRRPRR